MQTPLWKRRVIQRLRIKKDATLVPLSTRDVQVRSSAEDVCKKKMQEVYAAMIMAMYNQPEFYVEIDGIKSDRKVQSTGIRQGCPLSPYCSHW